MKPSEFVTSLRQVLQVPVDSQLDPDIGLKETGQIVGMIFRALLRSIGCISDEELKQTLAHENAHMLAGGGRKPPP